MSRETSLRASKARPYSLDEVQAAAQALREGRFRGAPPITQTPTASARASASRSSRTGPSRGRSEPTDAATTWSPALGECVVAVLGSAGSCGASTVALALALGAEMPARVVECSSASASGLAAATTAELGLHPSGWRQGRRDHVLIERVSDVLAGVDEVPLPVPVDESVFEPGPEVAATQLAVLDAGWEVGQLVTTDSWVSDALAHAERVIVTATATVPGMRRLESALQLLDARAADTIGGNTVGLEPASDGDRTWIAVRGPRRRKWPRGVEHAGGSHIRRAIDAGRVLEIPHDCHLELHGMDSRPLPAALLGALRSAART